MWNKEAGVVKALKMTPAHGECIQVKSLTEDNR